MEQNGISFSCIAYGTVVLAEGYEYLGSYTVIARKILARISLTDTKKSFEIKEDEGYKYHVYVDSSGLICLCRAASSVLVRICFQFLIEICAKFKGTYEAEYRMGTELSFNDRFTRVLKDRMDFYSNNAAADALTKLNTDIDAATVAAKETIETALLRGEQLETLEPKLNDLAATGSRFKKSSVAVKHKMWWKNAKVWVLMFFVLGVVVAIIVIVLLLALKMGLF